MSEWSWSQSAARAWVTDHLPPQGPAVRDFVTSELADLLDEAEQRGRNILMGEVAAHCSVEVAEQVADVARRAGRESGGEGA